MSTPPDSAARTATLPFTLQRSDDVPGVIILGGAHGALAIARSLGRRAIPSIVVTDDHPLPKFSRYVRKRFDWPGPASPHAAAWLIELAAREQLSGWMLIPCADGDVRMIASNIDALSQTFRLTSCGWDDLKHLCDKQLLPQLAATCGVDFPKAYTIDSAAEAQALDVQFPVVLKPATRESANAFTLAKAWRADSRDELIARFQQAASLVGGKNVVVQEFVPGGGEAQFSYTAVWHRGEPVMEMTARRTRQFPVEFSYTSTFVETIDRSAVVESSRRMLASIGFRGLVEIEYKFDARDGRHKVLDVNPRAWSWLALAEAAGRNMPLALYQTALGHVPDAPATSPRHVGWIHGFRDVLAFLQLLRRRELGAVAYLRSLWTLPLVCASFALDDPMPGLVELPLTALRVMTRRLPALLRRSRPLQVN